MSNASSPASNTSRQWLIGLTLLAVLILLLWWFWPSKPQSQQMGRGRFGDMGPVPVRVAEVEQGEFAIELKALGTVTAYNTVNVRSRVDGELVKVLFEDYSGGVAEIKAQVESGNIQWDVVDFEVIDLGVMVPAQKIIDTVTAHSQSVLRDAEDRTRQLRWQQQQLTSFMSEVKELIRPDAAAPASADDTAPAAD